MCGIVGVIAKKKTGAFTYKIRDVFQQMLFIDTLRGEDSTGMYAINKYGNAVWHKEASDANSFLSNATVGNTMKDLGWDYVAAVGHNRKATKGAVKDENAHPFVENNIILVHNGTLSNHKDLNATVEVDSHAIAHAFDEHGIEGGLPKIEGAFAIIAYEVLEKRLNLVRNKERPLWLAETDNFWAFSSEPWIMYGACWRNGFVLKNMRELAPGDLHTFQFSDDETTLSTKEVALSAPKANPVVIYTPPTSPSQSVSTSTTTGPFVIGQTVTFKPTKLLSTDLTATIDGDWDGEWKVRAHLGYASYTKEEVAVFDKVDKLVGTVISAHLDKKVIYVNDVGISVPFYTINNFEIDEEFQATLDMECSRCKSEIEEEEIPESYMRVTNKGSVIVHICPKCVKDSLAKNPKWGGINKHEKASTLRL